MRSIIGDDYPTLVHYFLGELAAGDQERVEERYMLDEAFAELRDEVETYLVDAYVSDALTPEQRLHFHDRYMITRARRLAVQAAYLSRVYRERIAGPVVTQTPFSWKSLGGWRLSNASTIPAVAAAVAAVVGVTLLLVVHEQTGTPSKNVTQSFPPVHSTAANGPGATLERFTAEASPKAPRRVANGSTAARAARSKPSQLRPALPPPERAARGPSVSVGSRAAGSALPVIPSTIYLGQSTADVVAILGPPLKIINLKSSRFMNNIPSIRGQPRENRKMIYVYRDLQITFDDGKVTGQTRLE